MSLNLEEIVGQIKEVQETKIANEKSSFKVDARILKFKKNCVYTLRLVPYIKNVANTFIDFKEVGFQSRTTGKYIYGGRSPQDAGIKNDLFKKTQWDEFCKAKESGDEVAMKATYKLLPQRKETVNAYLVNVEGDDAEAKEKIGTVCAVPYPAQVNRDGEPVSDIYKTIRTAVFGDLSKKIGTKAFDLSPKGRSLIVRVTEKAGFNNYSGTSFDDAEDLGLTEKQITEILNSAHDLTEFIPEVKSEEEIKSILDTHWFGLSASSDDDLDTEEEEKPKKGLSRLLEKVKDKDDEIPMGDSDSEEDELDALLKD